MNITYREYQDAQWSSQPTVIEKLNCASDNRMMRLFNQLLLWNVHGISNLTRVQLICHEIATKNAPCIPSTGALFGHFASSSLPWPPSQRAQAYRSDSSPNYKSDPEYDL